MSSNYEGLVDNLVVEAMPYKISDIVKVWNGSGVSVFHSFYTACTNSTSRF